jgi:outer membrane protein OmpA-like peptidoglycan-associated protein
MPSIALSWVERPWILVGLRLRIGFLSNGPAPKDPGIKDPGAGGLVSAAATLRLRPFAGRNPDSCVAGPWIELGTGPGLTGSLVRLVSEAGAGWDFQAGRLKIGPVARYQHVLQPSDAVDSRDSHVVLLGLEIGLRDIAYTQAQESGGAEPSVKVVKEKIVDRDGDGIDDEVDKCPDEPEDKDGFEDKDGCPDLDNDKDGIPDKVDACPNEAETVNGVDDADGCPDKGDVLVKEDRIVLTQKVLFDSNRYRVKSEGRPALTAVVNLWRQHPEWDRLLIDGYTDRHGSEKYNLWLSRKRAESAYKVLVEMGFPPDKLRLRAFGQRQLRAPADDEDADQKNRRVEFVIVKKGDKSATKEEPMYESGPSGENGEP